METAQYDLGCTVGAVAASFRDAFLDCVQSVRRCFQPYLELIRGLRSRWCSVTHKSTNPDSAAGRVPLEVPAQLTEGQRQIWDLLANQVLLGKQLAVKLGYGATSSSSIAHQIKRMRANGFVIKNARGVGYFRPDAPPPEFASR